MPDSGFEVVVWLIIAAAALVTVLTVLAMLFHFAVFGAIFGMVAKRIGEAHAEQGAASAGRRCGHCGSAVPAEAKDCPKCGAPAA